MLTHHLASSQLTWHAHSPTASEYLENSQQKLIMDDDFEGPGMYNEVRKGEHFYGPEMFNK
jgi:hypothetical protein